MSFQDLPLDAKLYLLVGMWAVVVVITVIMYLVLNDDVKYYWRRYKATKAAQRTISIKYKMDVLVYQAQEGKKEALKWRDRFEEVKRVKKEREWARIR